MDPRKGWDGLIRYTRYWRTEKEEEWYELDLTRAWMGVCQMKMVCQHTWICGLYSILQTHSRNPWWAWRRTRLSFGCSLLLYNASTTCRMLDANSWRATISLCIDSIGVITIEYLLRYSCVVCHLPVVRIVSKGLLKNSSIGARDDKTMSGGRYR